MVKLLLTVTVWNVNKFVRARKALNRLRIEAFCRSALNNARVENTKEHFSTLE